MQETLPIGQWVDFITDEYLDSFVKEGGTSVKFAVAPDELRPELRTELEAQAYQQGYLFAAIDAAEVRVHMPQDIFFNLAQQVDWRHLARGVILRMAEEQGYNAANFALDDADNVYSAIAEANSSEAALVFQHLQPDIVNRVFKNRRMARDFRAAMSQLCLRENTRAGQEYSAQPLLDWLTGRNPRISNLKPFFIHTPINRTTARHFMESALYWFSVAGYSGTVLLLDNSRVTLPRNPRDGLRYYTKAMAMDHYELLRELVDSADRLASTLLVVTSNPDFLDRNNQSRGFGMYPALMTRVMDDVRDKTLINPMASLIRIS